MESINIERKLFLYIAMSLDGCIAKQNGDIEFLSIVEEEGQDYDYVDFIRTIDTIILGCKTYDKVLSMGNELPYNNRDVYVFTHISRLAIGNVKFYSGNLIDLVLK